MSRIKAGLEQDNGAGDLGHWIATPWRMGNVEMGRLKKKFGLENGWCEACELRDREHSTPQSHVSMQAQTWPQDPVFAHSLSPGPAVGTAARVIFVQ